MLRSTLVEGVKQQELTKILAELIKRWEKGPRDPENNPAPQNMIGLRAYIILRSIKIMVKIKWIVAEFLNLSHRPSLS
ncbi:MAG: hypothetical protein WAW52_09985 [Methanothrix sp.]